MRILWLLVCASFSLQFHYTFAERVLGVETDEFDFDGLPGAQHEFKFEIAAGKEECFYQKIAAGGKLHVSFEVLRGGDQHLHFSVRKPFTKILQEVRTKPRWITAIFPEPGDDEGPYALCLDNTASLVYNKLVYMFLVTYVEEEWSQYRQEIESVQLTVYNFTASIQNVQQSITDALVRQAQSRMHLIKDWYLISGNNTYVQWWSICQCVVVMLCSCIQTVFVRRLFKTTNATSPSKPRA